MALTVPSFFEDENFQDHLTKLLIHDLTCLKTCGYLLSADDFKPLRGMRHGRPRWLIADRALNHFQRHHEPIGRLIRAEILEYGKHTGLGERQLADCEEYLTHLNKIPPSAASSVTDKVVRFKQEKRQATALEELNILQGAGALTEEKWVEITQQVMRKKGDLFSTNFFDSLDIRQERREMARHAPRVPLFMIDPLDSLVRGIGPGELGLVIAPTNRGKSLWLIYQALALTLQRFNVLYFTLEDPLKEVEDRFDAAITRIPASKLYDVPNLLSSRFARFRRLIRNRLHIYDGTDSGVTVAQIEQIAMRERDQGFIPHAVLVDYDEEINPAVHHKEKRFEYSDIYQDFRRVLGTHGLIGWMAAQTKRGTESMKILSGDQVAEDISKIKKTTLAVGLGKGDWGPDSMYLWVAKHKFDKAQVGCHIVSDKERMLIFDPEKTRKAAAQYEAPELDGEMAE